MYLQRPRLPRGRFFALMFRYMLDALRQMHAWRILHYPVKCPPEGHLPHFGTGDAAARVQLRSRSPKWS